MPDILQDDEVLSFKIAAEIGIEARHGLAAQRLDHLLRVAFVDVAIACARRLDHHHGSGRAGPHAASAAHVTLFAAGLGFLRKGVADAVAVLGKTAGAHADVDFEIVFLFFLGHAGGNLLEFFRIH